MAASSYDSDRSLEEQYVGYYCTHPELGGSFFRFYNSLDLADYLPQLSLERVTPLLSSTAGWLYYVDGMNGCLGAVASRDVYLDTVWIVPYDEGQRMLKLIGN